MKVIVNAAGYVGQAGGAGGAGIFLRYLVSRLSASCDVTVIVRPNSRHFAGKASAARFVELPYVSGASLRHLRSGPTVVIDPFGALPCHDFPQDMALCTVVHDLMHLDRPQFFTASERKGRTLGFATGLQRADAVVTFSADQAKAIRHYFPGTSPVVIPHLPYLCLGDTAPAAELPDGLGRYALLPAVKWPHKNHKTAIEAFNAYTLRTGSDLNLVLCGGPCAESRFSFFPDTDTLSERIKDLGVVSDETLYALYTQASAVLFPTLYEGFGIPVLEAAYLGKMVVASKLPVFDEILGPATYRPLTDPLCQLRWMAALADVEGEARETYERRSRGIRDQVSPERFTAAFLDTLTKAAERYTHPGLYPVREFAAGDRPTSTVIANLGFSDIYKTAKVEPGSRHAALGARTPTRTSAIFRSMDAAADLRQCLRAEYEVKPAAGPDVPQAEFSAWIRLLEHADLDRLNWSVNDSSVVDLLPTAKDGDWHLIRQPVPPAGYIDLRGMRGDQTEATQFDIEVFDPVLTLSSGFPPPMEKPLPRGLTILLAALHDDVGIADIVGGVTAFNAALPAARTDVQWVALARAQPGGELPAEQDIPGNLRLCFVARDDFRRSDATPLITPYEPLDKLLLLEAADLPLCVEPENLRIIGAALSPVPLRNEVSLALPAGESAFWRAHERGRIIDVRDRVGSPIPYLDPSAIDASLKAESSGPRRRFAVIETDLVGSISHHGTVTRLFLDGAASLGFTPVLGVHKSAREIDADELEVWAGFSEQVYAAGTADQFTEELTQFVSDQGLGPDDVVFMHSLSPQIVLGAARFVASHPASSPRFVMRFFSTAEAMKAHGLSYSKILKSILSVRAVREKMHFFAESQNLIEYYRTEVGQEFPLLLNPQPPALALVRGSSWSDPAIARPSKPVLGYFGEAREEKGFDDLPRIVGDLLQSEAMSDFNFLIQIGSNAGNQTPKVAKARAALLALKAQHPDRLRTFQSTDEPEHFYFLMKHATGIIAPYRSDSYGKRGSGVTLEALQMGLEVFAWRDTDLFATFAHTGRMIGVPPRTAFADTIIRHYANARRDPHARPVIEELCQPPDKVCERLLSLCTTDAGSAAGAADTVLWVGNDVFGEGCSAVYSAQKRAMRQMGHDFLELFVPWPDRNWAGVEPGAYDAKIYGFDSAYEASGLAWISRPSYTPQLYAALDEIDRSGGTYQLLRRISESFAIPDSLLLAIQANRIERTLLNYAHLYPVIKATIPASQIVCETHDIQARQNAVRAERPISNEEKIDELSDLAQFPKIIAISKEEEQEIASACPLSEVLWRLPPYIPEPPAQAAQSASPLAQVDELLHLGGVPDDIAQPSPAMLSLFYRRNDLRAVFELATEAGRMAFFRWWVLLGHLEAESHPFTRRQLDWLIQTDRRGKGMDGLARLLLSLRADLRAAFTIKGRGFNLKALSSWIDNYMNREYGFNRDALIQLRSRYGGNGAAQAEPPADGVMRAVLEADPNFVDPASRRIETLLERIADVETIDLAIVGSGHPSNIKSVWWFYHEVYLKRFANKGRNLFVVGSVCDHLNELTHRNLFMLGRCTRIEPLLRAAQTCPLPVITGSGAPIKTIPALAVNGAVTITEHIDLAFGLGEYGTPAFTNPRDFADDVWQLLVDSNFRGDRRDRASRYVQDNLIFDGYARFWEPLLAG